MTKNAVNKNTLALLALLCLMITACSGLFATDKTLSREFRNEASDSDLAVFFTPRSDNMTVALKNVGYSFMTNLSVSFECITPEETITEIYTIGNLKAYFNKNLVVPINYYKCTKLTISYTFIPMPDGGMGFSTSRNFIDPINPVENTFKLK